MHVSEQLLYQPPPLSGPRLPGYHIKGQSAPAIATDTACVSAMADARLFRASIARAQVTMFQLSRAQNALDYWPGVDSLAGRYCTTGSDANRAEAPQEERNA